ncbi:glycosyltransferase, partial [candidate division KSB1 bacterium]|nr:glycosyltransferase [candidate division KSB1 bacterium]
DYLIECIQSVVKQALDPETMQICVCDDCSEDQTIKEKIQAIAGTRVEVYRHPQRVGHIRNFNTCLNKAKGHLVHILHGDDQLRLGFYEKLTGVFESNQDIGAAFTRFIYIDDRGHWRALSGLEMDKPGIFHSFLPQVAVRHFILSAAMVVRRQVYEKVGGFCPQVPSYEDWDMWKRVGSISSVWYEPYPFVLYRKHRQTMSIYNLDRHFTIDGISKSIELSRSYLPLHSREKWIKQAKQIGARLATQQGKAYVNEKKYRISWRYIERAFKLYPHPVTLIYFYRYLKHAMRHFMQSLSQRQSIEKPA